MAIDAGRRNEASYNQSVDLPSSILSVNAASKNISWKSQFGGQKRLTWIFICRMVHWRLKHLLSSQSLHVSSWPIAAGSCLKERNFLTRFSWSSWEHFLPVRTRLAISACRVIKEIAILEVFRKLQRIYHVHFFIEFKFTIFLTIFIRKFLRFLLLHPFWRFLFFTFSYFGWFSREFC